MARTRSKRSRLALAVCDAEGRIYRDDRVHAAARSGAYLLAAGPEEFIEVPRGTSFAVLPGRAPVGYNPKTGRFVPVPEGHTVGGPGPVYAVAALLPQGYTRTLLPAYLSTEEALVLPIFGYTAVAFRGEDLVVAAMKTDEGDKWDPVHYNTQDLRDRIERRLALHPENRILKQLAKCSLEYQCFTAQNIFYERWEGGLPVSPACNANCIACISNQVSECCPSPQRRIDFVPTLQEVVEVGVHHLERADDAIISFGQGCEGEPTLQGRLIAEAVREMRKATDRGTININTNAGEPAALAPVVGAGLDSIRVSLISARPEIYEAYHRPRGYSLDGVKESIKLARRHGVFVSINLLAFPGLTDTEPEVDALCEFIEETGVNMVQVRNLNIDPDQLARIIDLSQYSPAGMRAVLDHISDNFPELLIGNYSRPVRGQRDGM